MGIVKTTRLRQVMGAVNTPRNVKLNKEKCLQEEN
jgi:hypothetical protein